MTPMCHGTHVFEALNEMDTAQARFRGHRSRQRRRWIARLLRRLRQLVPKQNGEFRATAAGRLWVCPNESYGKTLVHSRPESQRCTTINEGGNA